MATSKRTIWQGTVSATIAAALSLSTAASALSPEREHARLLKGHAVVTTEPRPGGHSFVKGRILIKATPQVVWNSVHEERQTDPDLAYSKLLSKEKNRLLLEQKFVFLPIIGTAVCVMTNEEVPLERIDYKLVKSDHFKAMEGSWVLSSCEHGTILELTTYLDMGYPVPRSFMDKITGMKLERRLNHVRNMAEQMQARLAEKPASS